MTRSFALTAAAALLLLANCSIQMNVPHNPGRVIISATRAQHHVVSHSLAHLATDRGVTRNQVRPNVKTPLKHPRQVASRAVRARDLSAANDINSMTYTLIRTATNTVVESKNIDPGYPYIDLFLTPGDSYRIIIDVDIKSSAPGTVVGVTRYGDQADFTVDYNYDTYVDLSVHPTASLVFDPASVGGTPAMVKVYNPSNMISPTNTRISSTGFTASPNDKFFYGPDAGLYYFNQADNAVYRWQNIGAPLAATDKIFDGDSLGTAMGSSTITLYAVCADPWDPTTLWALGFDTGDGLWYYYAVDITDPANNPNVFDYNEISFAFVDERDGGGFPEPANVVPTAIAVDSTWSDVYISYYSHVTTSDNVYSGLMQFYGGGIFASYPADFADFQFTGSTSSIITDIIWDQGKAWALVSPITAALGAIIPANTGTADLWTFDDFMNPLQVFPTTVSREYTGTLQPLTTALVVPNRFAGPVQGSKVYVSQADFQDVATHVLSLVNLTNPAAPVVSSY